MLDMQRVKNIHLVGIGGCGVSALAKILLEMGYAVSGSDLKEGPNTLRLKEIGADIHIGHAADQVRKADLLVYSSAVSADNVELEEAKLRGIQTLKRAEMLDWIINQSKTRIAVAGTHGKTTTTAMIAKMLDSAKLNPTFLIGCDMDYVEGNARYGNGSFAVTEADESDRSFLLLSPTVEVITNIEADHLENFGGLEELIDTFKNFAKRLPPEGFLVMDGTDPSNKTLIPQLHGRIITYGFDQSLPWHAREISFSETSSRFVTFHEGQKLGAVELSVPGAQNILNSLAAMAVGFELGLDFLNMTAALRTFTGAKRRFQILGETKGIMVVDDYAHHPTEIKATLAAAKAGWPGRRLVAVFQPHRYTRTLYLKDDFGLSFNDADVAVISDIYAASEKPIPGITGKTIVDAIKNREAIYLPRKEQIAENLVKDLKEGDIVLTLGAGDIYTVGKEILARLKMKNETAS